MKYIYEAVFALKLRTAIKEVAELEDSVNQSMKDFGCDKKLTIEQPFEVNITTEKELTDEEQYKIKVELESSVIKHMPQYDVRLKSFSRQSGNVQQSAE